MSSQDRDDPTWQAAWAWVKREHEHQGSLPATWQGEFKAWLMADSFHRKTYEEAARLWLLVGMVPPVEDGPQSTENP